MGAVTGSKPPIIFLILDSIKNPKTNKQIIKELNISEYGYHTNKKKLVKLGWMINHSNGYTYVGRPAQRFIINPDLIDKINVVRWMYNEINK